MAILGLLTDQKMPQSAEKGAQKNLFLSKIYITTIKAVKIWLKSRKIIDGKNALKKVAQTPPKCVIYLSKIKSEVATV